MLANKKRKIKNTQKKQEMWKLKILKKKKWSGDMAATRELAMKFGLDQCGGLRETRVNERQTTGWRTDDGRLRHESSSADRIKQS